MIKPIKTLTLLLSIALISIACDTGDVYDEKIQSSNEAARQSQSEWEFDNIHYLDLRDGDCFNAPDNFEIVNVELVPCSGEWMYRVLHSFLVDKEGHYPGDDYFAEQFHRRCDYGAQFFIYPLRDTWDQGDRTVRCIRKYYR